LRIEKHQNLFPVNSLWQATVATPKLSEPQRTQSCVCVNCCELATLMFNF